MSDKYTTKELIDRVIGEEGKVDSVQLAIIARLRKADALLSAAKATADRLEYWGRSRPINYGIMVSLRKAIADYEGGKTEMSIHVNPNCHDSTRCRPHGETGPVDYEEREK